MGIFSKKKKAGEVENLKTKAGNTRPVQSRPAEGAATTAPGRPALNGARRVLIRPHASEKAVGLEPHGTYLFIVRDDANKTLVKEEVERRYGVKVVRVNIVRNRGAFRFFRGRSHEGVVKKKALVTLAKGATIDLK